MVETISCAAKILHKYDDDSFYIVAYVDFDKLLTPEQIREYLETLVAKNDILKKHITEKGSSIFLEDVCKFDLNKHYDVEYTREETFDNHIEIILNSKIVTDSKWKFLFCIDKETNKSRYYLKIHHAYEDGTSLIKMLISPLGCSYNPEKSTRSHGWLDKLYYYVIGTIILILTNIKNVISIALKYIHPALNSNDNIGDKKAIPTDCIICKKLDFNDIKTFTKNHNMTINDFLYCLMIKTDKLYRNCEKILTTISPISLPGETITNNMCPIINTISNHSSNNVLFKTVHETFNQFKYSLFVPMLSGIINNIMQNILSLNVLTDVSNILFKNFDYVYSNIIGPKIDYTSSKVSDIHFLLTAKNDEIIYNIISYCDKINIVCSFKKDTIKDKVRFENCIYEAYNKLIAKA
jgi:hypothetical protein